MVAIGGPLRPSSIWDGHSLGNLSEERYSVRVSENPPVTCRVTILTPLTDGSGAINGVTEMRKSSNPLILSYPPPSRDGYGDLLYLQSPAPQPAFCRS